MLNQAHPRLWDMFTTQHNRGILLPQPQPQPRLQLRFASRRRERIDPGRLLVLHRPSRPSLAPAGNPPSPTCTERLAAGPGRAHVMICRSGGGGATSDAAVPVGETADSRTLSPPAQGTSPHLERPPGARRNAAAPPTASSFISS